MHVALGNGLGGFGPISSVQGPGTDFGIRLVDWNHDGVLDSTTIEIDVVTKTLGTRIGNGAGGFAVASSIVLANVDFTVAGFSNPADVNGDGNLDVATTTFSIVANMSFGGVMLGDGAGHFSFSGAGGGFFGAGPVSPTLGDV